MKTYMNLKAGTVNHLSFRAYGYKFNFKKSMQCLAFVSFLSVYSVGNNIKIIMVVCFTIVILL